jgi:hypothetical protein
MKVVYLNDSKTSYQDADVYFDQAAQWAREFCKSFVNHHVQDVSDVSLQWDYIAEYQFRDSRDAVIFELKWN